MWRETSAFRWVIAGIAVILGVLTITTLKEFRSLKASGLYPAPGSGTDADVRRLVESGQSLYAIRLYREIHGADLRTAKEAVGTYHCEMTNGATLMARRP